MLNIHSTVYEEPSDSPESRVKSMDDTGAIMKLEDVKSTLSPAHAGYADEVSKGKGQWKLLSNAVSKSPSP